MKLLLKPAPALLALGITCATSSALAQSLAPLVPADGVTANNWRFVGFPKSKADIPATRFELAEVQGERALKVSTRASYGTWVHDLANVNPGRLQWHWRLDQPLTGGKGVADILTKAGDDAALKVCVMFDHPLDRVPFAQRTLLRIARSVSGEDLPAATLCYVWDIVHPSGLQGANPYTQRVRFITLQGKGAPLAQWQTETRDVAADFANLFAEELPAGAGVPKVRAVLIGADSDNTGAQSVGWVRGLQWQP
jgi:hypothetical protein